MTKPRKDNNIKIKKPVSKEQNIMGLINDKEPKIKIKKIKKASKIKFW